MRLVDGPEGEPERNEKLKGGQLSRDNKDERRVYSQGDVKNVGKKEVCELGRVAELLRDGGQRRDLLRPGMLKRRRRGAFHEL